ncbi:MAG: hypothetical protein IPO27_10005 [Bacteroidetes bacterium]|nr:hypothetical protein [Bacteroidota bacterium]
MKKFSFLLLFVLTVLAGSVYAQSVKTDCNDYFAKWVGTNAKQQSVELKLNSDWTVSLTIGSEVLTGVYKMELENSVPVHGFGMIDFYSENGGASQTQTITLASNERQFVYSGIIAYDGAQMQLQLNNAGNPPTQFDANELFTLTK